MLNKEVLKMEKKYLISLILMIIYSFTFSQSTEKLVRKGNSQYFKGNYKDAEVDYNKALINDSTNTKALFNLGDALYKQENYEEALKRFESLVENNLDKKTKSKVYHNIGNTLLKSKKYPESIEAYKKALRYNPTDQDTKYNLSYALKMQQQQQQQQQQQNQNKDKEDNKDKKDQEKQEENKNENKDKDEQKQQQPKDQMSKSDAERMLNALNNKDKSLQDKVKNKKDSVGVIKLTIEKDW